MCKFTFSPIMCIGFTFQNYDLLKVNIYLFYVTLTYNATIVLRKSLLNQENPRQSLTYKTSLFAINTKVFFKHLCITRLVLDFRIHLMKHLFYTECLKIENRNCFMFLRYKFSNKSICT